MDLLPNMIFVLFTTNKKIVENPMIISTFALGIFVTKAFIGNR